MNIEFAWREDERRPRIITSSGLMLYSEYLQLVRDQHPCLLTGIVSLQGKKYDRSVPGAQRKAA